MRITYINIFITLFLISTFSYVLNTYTIFETPTVLWWFYNFIFLIITIIIINIYYNNDETPLLVVKLFLAWNIISIIRGFFTAENYWEWKILIETIFVFLIPLFVFIFIDQKILKKVMSSWYKYMLLISLLFIPFISHNDFLGRYLAPITFLLLVFPLLPKKWKIITLFYTILVLLAGFDARSNIIKFSIAFFLGIMYYFKFLFLDKFFKAIHITFFITPVILLILGLSGTFNIFKVGDYIKGDYTIQSNETGDERELNLKGDTRTFIYVETISSAIKYDYVIQGRTPARGYESYYFGDYTKYELGTGKLERFSSEVSILNFFTWNGLIGVILYFLVFFYSSFLAIYRSNNYFIKVIGLFVAFRWSFAFIEDFTKFDIQYIFLWLFISICFSKSFRNMTNEEFKHWIDDMLYKTKLFKIRKLR